MFNNIFKRLKEHMSDIRIKDSISAHTFKRDCTSEYLFRRDSIELKNAIRDIRRLTHMAMRFPKDKYVPINKRKFKGYVLLRENNLNGDILRLYYKSDNTNHSESKLIVHFDYTDDFNRIKTIAINDKEKDVAVANFENDRLSSIQYKSGRACNFYHSI